MFLSCVKRNNSISDSGYSTGSSDSIKSEGSTGSRGVVEHRGNASIPNNPAYADNAELVARHIRVSEGVQSLIEENLRLRQQHPEITAKLDEEKSNKRKFFEAPKEVRPEPEVHFFHDRYGRLMVRTG
ncbi:hypothetical protein GCM10023116_48360 [Kistimonas scapharcae]|uniref:Uncharacterized protein n=1 Tax=Kistimonas scapharcae TaxID=1036133 RepID=A0ABP8V9W3_9GAMM